MGRIARANIGYVRSALEPDEAEVRGKYKDGLYGRVLERDLGLHHGIAARVDRGQAGGGAQGRQIGGLTFARGHSRVRKTSALEGRNTRSHREVRRCGCAESTAGGRGLATHGDGCGRETTAKEKIAGDPGTRGRAGAGAGLVLGEESSRPCG